jgi:hypothetical protein
MGVVLTTHPLLVPRSRNSRAIPLPPVWAFGPFTGYLYLLHINGRAVGGMVLFIYKFCNSVHITLHDSMSKEANIALCSDNIPEFLDFKLSSMKMEQTVFRNVGI